MAKTRRARHLPSDEYAARRNTRRRLRTIAERGGKSSKQVRGNQRAALRKEV